MSNWVNDYFSDVDAMRLEAYLDRHSEDATVVFGNSPPAIGRTAIAEAIGGLFAVLDGVRHEQRNVWFVNGSDTAVVEALVHYTTKGGVTVALPAVSVLDRDPAAGVRSLRVHTDLGPLFGQVATEALPAAAGVSV